MTEPGPDSPALLLDRDRRASLHWRRLLWMLAGGLSLLLGVIGIFVPLLPTTPFVLLAAACFSRGSVRCEQWLLNHRIFGPMVRDWRAYRAVPLRAKQLATLMMAVGSAWAAWVLPTLRWLPALCCAAVALWLWRLPTRAASRTQIKPSSPKSDGV